MSTTTSEDLAVKSRQELRIEQQRLMDRIDDLEAQQNALYSQCDAIDEEIERINDRIMDIEDRLAEAGD